MSLAAIGCRGSAIATIPREFIEETCGPVMPTCADRMRAPEARSARSTEEAIASIAAWMLSTMPRLSPCEEPTPIPRMRISRACVSSATTVQTLVVPTSIAANVRVRHQRSTSSRPKRRSISRTSSRCCSMRSSSAPQAATLNCVVVRVAEDGVGPVLDPHDQPAIVAKLEPLEGHPEPLRARVGDQPRDGLHGVRVHHLARLRRQRRADLRRSSRRPARAAARARARGPRRRRRRAGRPPASSPSLGARQPR